MKPLGLYRLDFILHPKDPTMSGSSKESSGKGRAIAASIAGLTLVAALAWWWGLFGERIDPAVAELEALAKQMFAQGGPPGPPPPEFRAKIEALTEAQRQQFFQRNRPPFMAEMNRRMDALFAQGAEALRKEAKARAADVIAMRKQGDGAGGPGGPPWGNMSEAQRDEMRKRRLDFMDSDTRAQFTEMKRMVDEELKSQGQPPVEGRDFRAMMGGMMRPGGSPRG
jgi:hypothetical protein